MLSGYVAEMLRHVSFIYWKLRTASISLSKMVGLGRSCDLGVDWFCANFCGYCRLSASLLAVIVARTGLDFCGCVGQGFQVIVVCGCMRFLLMSFVLVLAGCPCGGGGLCSVVAVFARRGSEQ